jgi:hypothetical protein
MSTMAGLDVLAVFQLQQGRNGRGGPDDNVAALATVSAVGASRGTNFSLRKLTQPRPPSPAFT